MQNYYTQTIGLEFPAKNSFGNMCAIGRESDQPHIFPAKTYGIGLSIAMKLIPVLAFSQGWSPNIWKFIGNVIFIT